MDLSEKFIKADELLRTTIAEKHHSSLEVAQKNLGDITPVHYIANGGDLKTIINMFPKHNIGG